MDEIDIDIELNGWDELKIRERIKELDNPIERDEYLNKLKNKVNNMYAGNDFMKLKINTMLDEIRLTNQASVLVDKEHTDEKYISYFLTDIHTVHTNNIEDRRNTLARAEIKLDEKTMIPKYSSVKRQIEEMAKIIGWKNLNYTVPLEKMFSKYLPAAYIPQKNVIDFGGASFTTIYAVLETFMSEGLVDHVSSAAITKLLKNRCVKKGKPIRQIDKPRSNVSKDKMIKLKSDMKKLLQ